MIPTFVGTSIITTSVSAAVILQETATLIWWRLIGYWSGIWLVVSGLVIIARDARLEPLGLGLGFLRSSQRGSTIAAVTWSESMRMVDRSERICRSSWSIPYSR